MLYVTNLRASGKHRVSIRSGKSHWHYTLGHLNTSCIALGLDGQPNLTTIDAICIEIVLAKVGEVLEDELPHGIVLKGAGGAEGRDIHARL